MIQLQSCKERMLHEVDMIITQITQSLYYHRPFPCSSFAVTTRDGEEVVFNSLYDDQSGGVYGANCVHAGWWKNPTYVYKYGIIMKKLQMLRQQIYVGNDDNDGNDDDNNDNGNGNEQHDLSWRRSLSTRINDLIQSCFVGSVMDHLLYIYHDVDLYDNDHDDDNDNDDNNNKEKEKDEVHTHTYTYSYHPQIYYSQKQKFHITNHIEGFSRIHTHT